MSARGSIRMGLFSAALLTLGVGARILTASADPIPLRFVLPLVKTGAVVGCPTCNTAGTSLWTGTTAHAFLTGTAEAGQFASGQFAPTQTGDGNLRSYSKENQKIIDVASESDAFYDAPLTITEQTFFWRGGSGGIWTTAGREYLDVENGTGTAALHATSVINSDTVDVVVDGSGLPFATLKWANASATKSASVKVQESSGEGQVLLSARGNSILLDGVSTNITITAPTVAVAGNETVSGLLSVTGSAAAANFSGPTSKVLKASGTIAAGDAVDWVASGSPATPTVQKGGSVAPPLAGVAAQSIASGATGTIITYGATTCTVDTSGPVAGDRITSSTSVAGRCGVAAGNVKILGIALEDSPGAGSPLHIFVRPQEPGVISGQTTLNSDGTTNFTLTVVSGTICVVAGETALVGNPAHSVSGTTFTITNNATNKGEVIDYMCH